MNAPYLLSPPSGSDEPEATFELRFYRRAFRCGLCGEETVRLGVMSLTGGVELLGGASCHRCRTALLGLLEPRERDPEGSPTLSEVRARDGAQALEASRQRFLDDLLERAVPLFAKAIAAHLPRRLVALRRVTPTPRRRPRAQRRP